MRASTQESTCTFRVQIVEDSKRSLTGLCYLFFWLLFHSRKREREEEDEGRRGGHIRRREEERKRAEEARTEETLPFSPKRREESSLNPKSNLFISSSPFHLLLKMRLARLDFIQASLLVVKVLLVSANIGLQLKGRVKRVRLCVRPL